MNDWEYFKIYPKMKQKENKSKLLVFKDCGLSITTKCNLKSVDFLDLKFDLVNDVYKPYRKPNNKPLYINKYSNQPPKILKQLPKSIEKYISETSSNIDVFNRSIKIYNDALHERNLKRNIEICYTSTKEE